MVYLEDWEEFSSAAQALFQTSPNRTRYLVKYRACDSKTVLKVTNDQVVLKYKTDQLADIRKIEKLSQSFVRWCVTKNLGKLEEEDAELQDAKVQSAAEAKAAA